MQQECSLDWIEARASLMGVPAVLADGAELDVLNPQLQDAALADLAKFSEARIATLLSVPPFLVGLSGEGAATYINATNVFDFHWRAGLRPKAEAFAQALAGWLLPRGWTVELDRDDYIKPGMFERACKKVLFDAYCVRRSLAYRSPNNGALRHRSGRPRPRNCRTATKETAPTFRNAVDVRHRRTATAAPQEGDARA